MISTTLEIRLAVSAVSGRRCNPLWAVFTGLRETSRIETDTEFVELFVTEKDKDAGWPAMNVGEPDEIRRETGSARPKLSDSAKMIVKINRDAI